MNSYAKSIILLLFIVLGCQGNHSTLQFDHYFDKPSQEKILAQIMNYVYATPSSIQTSLDSDFFDTHKKEMQKFKMVHFRREGGKYYFYMIRPAGNAENQKRGLAGVFTLDTNMKIKSFEEVFVTKLIPEEQIVIFGNLVFQDFIDRQGEIPLTHLRKDIIEFPNEQSSYDEAKFAWTYDSE